MNNEILKFNYKNVEFLVEVYFSSQKFEKLIDKEVYKIKLIKPIYKEFTYIQKKPQNRSSAMLFSYVTKKQNFYFDTDLNKNDNLNICYKAIFLSVDWYFNNKKLLNIENKIKEFKTKLDNRYKQKIDKLYTKKKELKFELKNKNLDNKKYQKQIIPINKQLDFYAFTKDNQLQEYKNNFFDCCELKDSYKQEVFDSKFVQFIH